MICKNCNTQITEDAKFCHSCGMSLNNSIRKQKTAKQMKSVYEPRKELRAGSGKKWHILLPAAGILFTAVILTVLLFPFQKMNREGFVYLKQGEFYYSSAKSIDPIELTEDFYGDSQVDRSFEYRMNFMVKFNQNGNRVFYPGEISGPGGEVDLYCMDLKNKGAEPVRIAKSIWNYEINDAGSRVYYINSKNELYESNLSDEDRIASGVSYFMASEDGSRLIWFDQDNHLYYKSGAGDMKIIDSITEIVDWTPDLRKIYYQKGNEVFLSADGSKGEKILSGVSKVLMVYEAGEIYYTHQAQEEKKLIDFVEDDMLEEDQNISEPKQPQYPSYEDYRPEMQVPEEPDWYDYTDRKGSTDWDSYQKDYEIYTKKIKHYNSEWDRLYQEAMEQYELEYDSYEAAEMIFKKKNERDSLRKALEQEPAVITHSTLYFYDLKESVVVSDTYQRFECIAEDLPAIVYANHNYDAISKMKLSEITCIEEVASHVNGADLSSLEIFAAVGAVPSKVETEQGGSYEFDPKLNYLYYTEHYDTEKGFLEFYRVPILDSGLGTPELYDQEVSSFWIPKGYDSVLYFKKGEGSKGDLFMDKNRIDRDVSYFLIIPSESGNGFYYITDYDRETSSGTLMFYDGKEAEEISGDVYDYHVLDDKKVLYLKDYDPEKGAGKACLYQGKEIEIDEGVSMLLKLDKYFDYYQEDLLGSELN